MILDYLHRLNVIMSFKSRRESQVDVREEEAWGDLTYHHWLENGESGMRKERNEGNSGNRVDLCSLQGIKETYNYNAR